MGQIVYWHAQLSKQKEVNDILCKLQDDMREGLREDVLAAAKEMSSDALASLDVDWEVERFFEQYPDRVPRVTVSVPDLWGLWGILRLSTRAKEVTMKLKRYCFVLVIMLLVIIGLFVSAFWIHPIIRYQTYRAASRFYDSLIGGDYALAFNHLAYCDRYSDLAPDISRTAAKAIWVERVDALREAEVYLKDVEALEVHFDDGYPVGTARVTVMDRGQVITSVQQIHFVERAGVWMVQSVLTISGESEGAMAQINRAISGLVEPAADSK